MKKKTILLIFLTAGIIISRTGPAGAENNQTGTIQRKVLDRDTKIPFPFANVMVEGTPLGAATDTTGQFTIAKVPIGGYTVRFSCLGYETTLKPDVIVKSNRIVFVAAEMKNSLLEIKDMTVTTGYFAETEDQPTSAVNFSSEEIRRAPGSAGAVFIE